MRVSGCVPQPVALPGLGSLESLGPFALHPNLNTCVGTRFVCMSQARAPPAATNDTANDSDSDSDVEL